jgi:hypothetical protein
MRFSGFVAGAVAAAFIVSASAPGMAASMPDLSILKGDAAAQSQVEQAHFWHRTCRHGANGWHKHVKGVGRIQCTTGKCWTNALGYKQCKYF